MRCKACDTILNDYELKAKDSEGHYLDLCGTCKRHSYDAYGEPTVFTGDLPQFTQGLTAPLETQNDY